MGVGICRSMLRLIAYCGAGTFLGGCIAGITKTHVSPPDFSSSYTPDRCAELYDSQMCKELQYADEWVIEYTKAGTNPSNFRSAIAAVTIPASAVAAFYGVTGHGSADRIARLSLGTAATYAFGTYFGGKGKQATYFEGALAMSCVQSSAFPALEPKADQDAVMDARSELERLLAVTSTEQIVTPSQAAIIAEGESMLTAARDYLGFLRTAPLRLRGKINRLALEVNQLLLKQEPTINSLISLAGSLNSGTQSQVVNTPEDAITKVEVKADTQAAVPPEQKMLVQNLKAIMAYSWTIRQRTKSLSERLLAFNSIDACSPKAEINTLSVVPSNSAVSLVVGQSKEFSISDSSGFPSVSVSGRGVSVEPLVVRGAALVLSVKANNVDGGTVTVRNAAGELQHPIKVVVTAPDAVDLVKHSGSENPPVAQVAIQAGQAGPLNEIEKEIFRDPLLVLKLQCLVNLPPASQDCAMGPITRAAMKLHIGSIDGAVTEELRNQMDRIEVSGSCGVKTEPGKAVCIMPNQGSSITLPEAESE